MKNYTKLGAKIAVALLLLKTVQIRPDVKQHTTPNRAFYEQYYDSAVNNLNYYANAFAQAVSAGTKAVTEFLKDERNREALIQLLYIASTIVDEYSKTAQAQKDAEYKAAEKARRAAERYEAELRQEERRKAQENTYYPGPLRTGHDYSAPQAPEDQNVYQYGPMRTGHEHYEQHEPYYEIDPTAFAPQEPIRR